MFEMNDFEVLKNDFKGSRSLEESFTEEVLDVYKYYWAKGGIKYPISYYKMALKTVIGRKISNEKISTPTLILWGKQDSALVDEIPKRMTQLCSDIQLKYIETAGHFPHEEDPVTVNKMIWNYIHITQ
ncbi:hypothetical protein Anas_11273 [Armadillidium nasatum]|uniref:AB hydrolase-1 domain-containing protein n=1 Tax=Armadillidium nasatum TaxID=96803 RepID=A0A5N5TF28_9CRUS|nr:hypothetical protein Anas_11273 [Armadillidium nasatum]